MGKPRIAQRVLSAATSATLATKAVADRLRAQGVAIADLGLGEPDFDTPDHVKDAAHRAIRENRTHYTPVAGIPELRRAIAARYAALYGAAYDEDDVLVGSGAKGILFSLSQALFQDGDEVAIFAPYWVSYPEQVKLAGATPVFVPTQEAEGFAPSAAALESRITPRTRAVVLNSPCNPTGAVVSAREWQSIADLALAKGLVIISDEVYESFVYGGEPFVSATSCLRRLKDHLVVVSAVSKSFAMTGWRVGYAVGPREIVKAAAMIQSHDSSQAATFCQWGALEALTGTQAPLTAMVAEYARRREIVIEGLAGIPGIRSNALRGAFYAFPNVTGLYPVLGVSSSEEVCAALLREARVVTVAGEGFGAPGYLRISYAAPAAVIRDGLARIRALVGTSGRS